MTQCEADAARVDLLLGEGFLNQLTILRLLLEDVFVMRLSSCDSVLGPAKVTALNTRW